MVTGIGVVAPNGDRHRRALGDACSPGSPGIGPITLFDPAGYPTRLAGEVPDFDPPRYADNRRLVQTDRWTHLGFAATRLALADAGLPERGPRPVRLGGHPASSSGGNEFGQRELQRLWGGPTRTVGAYQSIAWFYAASVGQISIQHQFKGPCGVLVAEAAGGLDSLAHAVRTIRRGTPVVIAGATECPLSPYALACQLALRAAQRRRRPGAGVPAVRRRGQRVRARPRAARSSWWRSWGTRWPGAPGSTAR